MLSAYSQQSAYINHRSKTQKVTIRFHENLGTYVYKLHIHLSRFVDFLTQIPRQSVSLLPGVCHPYELDGVFVVAFTGVLCMPLYIPYSLTRKWHLGRGICKLWLVMDYFLCTASVSNIVLISYDCFLPVTKAVNNLFGASLIFFLGWLYLPAFAMLMSISPNLMNIIPLKNILACGDYWIFFSQMG